VPQAAPDIMYILALNQGLLQAITADYVMKISRMYPHMTALNQLNTAFSTPVPMSEYSPLLSKLVTGGRRGTRKAKRRS
jgi:hypothetical protein